jgi:hypothetical protein
LLIIAGILFYLRRRRKTHVAPSAQYRDMSTRGGGSDAASLAAFRRLPSNYAGSSSSRSGSSLGLRDPAESLRGGSPISTVSNQQAMRVGKDGHSY